MSDPRLSDVLARRGVLAPAEVVTLVVALALDLAELHATGGAHGCVCAETIRFDPDGRPRLCAGIAGGTPAGDVYDLAALGYLALSDQPPRLAAALKAALDDGCTADELAERVLASGPAAPLRLPAPRTDPVPVERAVPEPWRRRAGLVTVAVLAVGLGTATQSHSHSVDRWGAVLARLDRARSAAVADRRASELLAVYAPGSIPLVRDAALIGGLTRRGLVLRGRLAELTGARQLSRSGNDIALSVLERPASYVLLDARGHVVLRVRGNARRLVVRLHHTRAGWRVTTVG